MGFQLEVHSDWSLTVNRILQIVFQWQDHHLHEFTVYNGDNPLVKLFCGPEGDDWEHEIIAEKMIDAYFRNYPECLEGLGNTPPEDVGREHGYDEFLHVISDPNHPEYQDMLSWGRMQHYEDFKLEFVNRRLKTVLREVWER